MMTEVGTLRRDAILLTEDTADVVVDPAVLVDTESLQTVSGEGLVAPGKGICVKNWIVIHDHGVGLGQEAGHFLVPEVSGIWGYSWLLVY